MLTVLPSRRLAFAQQKKTYATLTQSTVALALAFWHL
jgi:hypothetical protein